MAQTSIEQPVAWQPPAGHRPISLLLQALRQIDSKLPAYATPLEPLSQPRNFCNGGLAAAEPVSLEPAFFPPTVGTPAGADSILVAPFAALAEEREISQLGRAQPVYTTSAERLLADQVAAVLQPADRVLAVAAVDSAVEPGGIAAMLALGLSACEERGVLLIEQRPESRSRLPGGVAASDFVDLIEGRANWSDVAEGTTDSRLRVLPVSPPGPGAGVTSGDLRRGWRTALDRVQFIVLDTSGINEPQLTALLCSCDAVLALVRRGQTGRRRAQRRIEQWRQAGAELRGCLFVDF